MPFSNNISFERILVYVLIAVFLGTVFFISYLFFSKTTAAIEVKSPNGGEEWGIGQDFKITWKARGIDKVGIVLFEGKEAKWISQDIPANLEKYEWKIYPGQKYGDNYWIAVFEYPWKKDNKIDFSDGSFAIVYPNLASCEGLSVINEWPHVPSDMPNLRKVFITENNYKGNLGGLDGADRICMSEARKQGLSGNWRAFLGGESDDDLAVKRVEKTPRGTAGIFIESRIEATLIRGASCHRLIAKDFNDFLEIFSNPLIVNKEKLRPDLYDNLNKVWLGRINEESKKSCIESDKKYSLSVACQNWSMGAKLVSGSSLPSCYNPSGAAVSADVLAGLSSGIIGASFSPFGGQYCDSSQKIICIED